MPELTNEQRQVLIDAALRVRMSAYAPYSHFQVGAALLADSGAIYVGTNIENSSYGLTNCAERVALGAAIAAGERLFVAIAIASPGGHAPCGACRQCLAEFGELLVLGVDADSRQVIKQWRLSELLPAVFHL